LGFGLIVQVAVNWLIFRAVDAFGQDVYSPRVMKAILPRSPREQILVPLAILPAALLEELLFRSLLLGGFSLFAPPLLLAAVFSLLFGLMHAPQQWATIRWSSSQLSPVSNGAKARWRDLLI